jgi:hypothetical protein
VEIWMNAHYFAPGDVAYCRARVCNLEAAPLVGHPLFVVLDVHGVYFFGPSFTTDLDSYLELFPEIPVGETPLEVLPPFTWPEGAGSDAGIVWYAALTDPTMSRLVGELGAWEFGWGSANRGE